MAAAAATRGNVTIGPVVPGHLDSLFVLLDEIKQPYELRGDRLHITPGGSLKSFKLQSLPYPGFPTDLQAPFGVLATQCGGTSLIHDPLFEGRMGYVNELVKMGANAVICDPHRVLVTGPTPLNGQEIRSLDLRAGATLVIAGLLAEGETHILMRRYLIVDTINYGSGLRRSARQFFMQKREYGGDRRSAAGVHARTLVSREISAGGIVYRRLGNETLIGFIRDPYNKWIFPKGHVEHGEGIRNAAVRETKEEMGLRTVRPQAKLGTISFAFKFKNRKIFKTVHYYLMQVAPHEVGRPQKREKIREIRWVPLARARAQLGYKNTGRVLDRALALLRAQKLSGNRNRYQNYPRGAQRTLMV